MKGRLLFGWLLFLLCPGAFAQGFIVDRFTADFYLRPEGYFDVVEKYEVTFTEEKHGLLRNIITDYNFKDESGNTEKRRIFISDIEVPGHSFEKSNRIEQRLNGQVEIKIGDKAVTVIGPQQYEVRYRVKNALIFSDSIVAFYWNVRPSDWSATFSKVLLRVHAPAGAELSDKNCFVYAGASGNDEPSGDFILHFNANTFSAESKKGVTFHYGENVTTLVKLPRNLIAYVDYGPSALQRYGWIALLLLILLLFWWVWWKWGRDERAIAVTSYYPPEGIDPAMAGYLINDAADTTDLIALLPKWGAEGRIRIEEIPKKGWFGSADTRIIKLDDLPDGMPRYEEVIFYGLFAVADTVYMSSLRNTFYKIMLDAREKLKTAAQTYYVGKSTRIMQLTYVLAVLLGIAVTAGMFYFFSILAAVVSAIVFLFILLMTTYLRKKNSKGNEVLSQLKGFRQFIRLAEVERIKFLITDDPHYFEKTMSYALAFGLLKQWAGKFDALNLPPPTWYSSTAYGTNMSMHHFASSFSSSMSSAQSNMASAPSSSSSGGGGGSSSGGFGGGGGGSW